MNILKLRFIGLLISLSLAAPFASFCNEKVKIAMGYIPNVQFAPYYIAVEKGFFREQNLDIEFDYGWATDIMTLVAKGAVDFGISDGDQVVVARDRGIPIKVIYSMYVKYPVAIVSFEEKGIENVHSLAGKTVGTPHPYGSNYIGLQILLNSAGLTLEDIELKFIGYTQVESLIGRKVDAAVVFVNNEAVVLRDMGRKINVLTTYDVTPMVSAVVITGESLIRKRPETARRFIKAVIKASEYALSNKDEVMSLLRKHVPTITDENMSINQKVLEASMQLWVDRDIEGNGVGFTSKEDWEESIRVLRSLGIIHKQISPQECFTNDFLQ
jgi:NitT/TauT family transport system substrate-binding protein